MRLMVLLAIGIILLTVLSAIIGLLPAIVAAVIAYLLTGSVVVAGLVFVVVAFVWVLVKKH
jgi:hypothetical protein